jgi:hypothetical protein
MTKKDEKRVTPHEEKLSIKGTLDEVLKVSVPKKSPGNSRKK